MALKDLWEFTSCQQEQKEQTLPIQQDICGHEQLQHIQWFQVRREQCRQPAVRMPATEMRSVYQRGAQTCCILSLSTPREISGRQIVPVHTTQTFHVLHCDITVTVTEALVLEMGRMSDYDIRLKPKVWAGSPNECRTFGRTLYARVKQCLLLVSALSGKEMS